MFSLIVAHDRNFAIGLNGWMPWRLKEDLKLFKEITLNHTIVMGSTTFNALPSPLPKRKTVVITSKLNLKHEDENVVYCNDFEKYLKENQNTEEEIFICGGASIYKTALPYCKKLYISLVEGDFEADTFLFPYDVNQYNIIHTKNYDGFQFIEYQKKENYES